MRRWSYLNHDSTVVTLYTHTWSLEMRRRSYLNHDSKVCSYLKHTWNSYLEFRVASSFILESRQYGMSILETYLYVHRRLHQYFIFAHILLPYIHSFIGHTRTTTGRHAHIWSTPVCRSATTHSSACNDTHTQRIIFLSTNQTVRKTYILIVHRHLTIDV